MQFDGHNLDLRGKEPSAQEVLALLNEALQAGPAVEEVVFCGYGEPTMRLDILLEVGRSSKTAQAAGKYPPFSIRLNTNGLGNLINKRNIVPDLKTAVDKVFVSLNAQNETLWRKIMRPAAGYENGFLAVLDFIKTCASAGFKRVAASCVENTGADSEAVATLAQACGAQFHGREFLDEQ